MTDGKALIKGLAEAQYQKAVGLCVDQNRLDISANNPYLSVAFVLKNLLHDRAKSALGHPSASPGNLPSMRRFSTAPPQKHVIPHSLRQGRRAPEILTRATECFHPK